MAQKPAGTLAASTTSASSSAGVARRRVASSIPLLPTDGGRGDEMHKRRSTLFSCVCPGRRPFFLLFFFSLPCQLARLLTKRRKREVCLAGPNLY